MPSQFTITRTVEFAETDMAGIMHFSNYFRFMESTEHAFFRSLGLTLHERRGQGTIGWARVHAECTYRQPLRYQDAVEVQLLVREKRQRSIGYLFIFRRRDEQGGEPVEVARGAMSVVCVTADVPGGEMQAVPMPREVAERVEVAPTEVLGGRATERPGD
jgi:YbgC/YbaW family acyl-CoA thioester hydrolase